jgi:GAF domain-containing protein
MFCINAHQKNHFKPEQFPLFQQIANQVTIAIANILANEELEQRAAALEASNAELRRQDALLLNITEATQCLLENDRSRNQTFTRCQ